jgi:N-acetylglucosaminyldiphosphoundecaprenol N-acetyl-beta-D-mannosaminyltransferase
MRMLSPNQAPVGAVLEGTGLDPRRVGAPLNEVLPEPGPAELLPDDLSREVYCVLGMPVDAVDMAAALHRVAAAARSRAPYLISTPNLNFLANSLQDAEFRDSLLQSDLCTADGAPIVWIARLLGIPLTERVAGSDMFDRLAATRLARKLGVFFFGGAPGTAAAACEKLSVQDGLCGVGAIDPGYASVGELSGDRFIDAINASDAQFLVVALGAAKGQAWLMRNHNRLQVPVRAHLGATVNFQAGDVKRAPRLVRRSGLEWLWRIKEEPHLWKRYWADAGVLLRLLITRVVPLARLRRQHQRAFGESGAFEVTTLQGVQVVTLRLCGHATAQNIARAIVHFRNAINLHKNRLVVDLSGLEFADARFLGLLLMVHKQLKVRGSDLQLVGASRDTERLFRLNELGHLLSKRRAR